ncbi:hypothetical protein M5689_022423 [Euphorbia peplus]|nr:hypothetical protein M5689_022423 [Euphorbia peplus]
MGVIQSNDPNGSTQLLLKHYPDCVEAIEWNDGSTRPGFNSNIQFIPYSASPSQPYNPPPTPPNPQPDHPPNPQPEPFFLFSLQDLQKQSLISSMWKTTTVATWLLINFFHMRFSCFHFVEVYVISKEWLISGWGNFFVFRFSYHLINEKLNASVFLILIN